mgnify:CR=1 FL=1
MKSQARPKIGFMCSYIPFQILNRLGFELYPLYDVELEQYKGSCELPTNICSYVRYSLNTIKNLDLDGIILTNCCNGVQRLYDYLKIYGKNLYCSIIEIPRENSNSEINYFTSSVLDSIKALCNYFHIPFTGSTLGNLDCIRLDQHEINDKTIYVIGNIIPVKLKEVFNTHLSKYQVNYNLCSTRKYGDSVLLSAIHSGDMSDIQSESISSVNNVLPCARMRDFGKWFKMMLAEHHERISGIIYVTSQHCDSYLFSFNTIKKVSESFGIPIMSVEVNYGATGYGQMMTRLDAFIECIDFRVKKNLQQQDISMPDIGSDMFRKRMHLIKAVADKQPLKAIQKLVSNQADIFSNLLYLQPEKIVMTNMVMPAEIFYAADLIPINIELIAGWASSLGLSKQYISKIEGSELSPSVCSYHKTVVGLINDHAIPTPKGMAVTSNICDGGVGIASYCEHKFNTDTFILNVPFNKNDSSLEYVVEQIHELIKWAEMYSGRPFDMDRLKQCMERSNEAMDLWKAAYELRKGEPLFSGHLALRNLFGTTFLFGSDLGVEVARDYYDELVALKTRMDSKGGDGKKRLLWIHFAPLYNNRIMEYLEEKLNCNIVVDITGYIYWEDYDIERPIESLANRMLSHFYMDNPTRRQQIYKTIIEEYKVDGIVHFMHNGCRAIPGSSWLVRDIASRCHVPYLELSGDCIDPRGFSEEQMKMRFEAFKETLEGVSYVFRS